MCGRVVPTVVLSHVLYAQPDRDDEFAGVENAGVNLSAPDCGTGKCRSENITESNVWKAKRIIMYCSLKCFK